MGVVFVPRGETFGDSTQDVLMPPESEPLEQFFASDLPPGPPEVSREFRKWAAYLIRMLPRNPERTVALRKLLEAKDGAVRALLVK